MATIMIPEAAAQVVARVNGAIARMGDDRLPWFIPRQIKIGTNEKVGLIPVGNDMGDLFRQKVRIFGGGITVIATMMSCDCGQSGWSHWPTKLVIRFGGDEWLFRPRWARPVLVKTATRRYHSYELAFLKKWPTRWMEGRWVDSYTAAEIRAGFDKR